MSDPDLVTLAGEAAAAKTDLYELLGVDATTSKADIHRAWRRKGLQYHPDKAGEHYDAAKYEAFERARNILSDDAARAAYDGAVAAAAQRARRAETMGAERRQFKEQLEEAERRAAAARSAAATAAADDEAARKFLREYSRRQFEEREQASRDARREADAREEAQFVERVGELERRLDEAERRKAERRAERKAEKKRARGQAGGGEDKAAGVVEGKQQKQKPQHQPPPPPPDGDWKAMVGQDDILPFHKRPIYAHTVARLKAAGAARRAKLGDTTEFVPRWDEVKDPAVRQFIARVPRLASMSKTKDAEDADMEEPVAA